MPDANYEKFAKVEVVSDARLKSNSLQHRKQVRHIPTYPYF
jgi:hypothetical protein